MGMNQARDVPSMSFFHLELKRFMAQFYPGLPLMCLTLHQLNPECWHGSWVPWLRPEFLPIEGQPLAGEGRLAEGVFWGADWGRNQLLACWVWTGAIYQWHWSSAPGTTCASWTQLDYASQRTGADRVGWLGTRQQDSIPCCPVHLSNPENGSTSSPHVRYGG